MNITKEFKNSTLSTDKDGKVTGYSEGQIALEAPKLSEWSDADLDALGEWLARQLIHYGPSAAYKAAHGQIDKLNSAEGRYTCSDGVFKINPNWRPGQMSEEAFAKKIKLTESILDRPLTEDELSAARAKAGLAS